MSKVYTIGHSNQPAADFLALLEKHDISLVMDVRSKPYSRFRHFSREPLAARLSDAGIDYDYIGDELGGHPEQDEFYENGRVLYERLVVLPEFRRGINRVSRESERRQLALMCTEEDPTKCHRHPLLARALLQRGIQVHHLRRNGSVQHASDMKEQMSEQIPLVEPVGEDRTWQSPKRVRRQDHQSNTEIHIPETLDSAIVFGHADGDGHLAAEQTREWLTSNGLSVTTVVSPATRNYMFWAKLSKFNLSGYGLVVFVDIAFRFRDPRDSLSHLLKVADHAPQVQFIAIAHHPMIRPPRLRKNLRLLQVTDPYDCCLGVPDPELMQVAALCDGSPTAVTPTPHLSRRALGVKRAAADVDGVAGDILLGLIRNRRWDFFEALAAEDREMHLSARGLRRRASKASPLLEYARNHSPSGTPKLPPELSR